MGLERKYTETLELISHQEAIKVANRKIDYYRKEKNPGLFSRWPVVNDVMGGCFRFGEVLIICGSSGSGKSYFLNMLRDDFLGEINAGYTRDFKILSFSFEMSSSDEVLRTYASKLRTSYSALVSAKEKVDDKQFDRILKVGDNIKSSKLYFVESSGNYQQIYNTVEKFWNDNNRCNLIITMDHTLLAEYLNESSEVELVSNLARLSIRLKKDFGAMVIFLSQLNDKIEQPDRITNENMHYPQRTDIHGSKAIYMAADTLVVIHRPERIGIKNYGIRRLQTEGLVALHFLKSRLYGEECLIKMRADFSRGNLIHPYEEPDKQATLKI